MGSLIFLPTVNITNEWSSSQFVVNRSTTTTGYDPTINGAVIPVVSSTGFQAGDFVTVETNLGVVSGDDPSDTRMIVTVGTGTITVDSALQSAYASGCWVRRLPNDWFFDTPYVAITGNSTYVNVNKTSLDYSVFNYAASGPCTDIFGTRSEISRRRVTFNFDTSGVSVNVWAAYLPGVAHGTPSIGICLYYGSTMYTQYAEFVMTQNYKLYTKKWFKHPVTNSAWTTTTIRNLGVGYTYVPTHYGEDKPVVAGVYLKIDYD